MTPEEEAALCALAVADVPTNSPSRKPTHVSGKWHYNSQRAAGIIKSFLHDYEVRRGTARGIEVCSFYRLYAGWHAKYLPTLKPLPPKAFAYSLKHHFQFKKRREYVGGVKDTRPLGVNAEAAKRLRAWLRENPDTPESRALLNFTAMRRIPKGERNTG